MSQWGDQQQRTRSDFVYGDVSQAQNKAHQITFKAPLELELLVFDVKCPLDFTGFPWTVSWTLDPPGHILCAKNDLKMWEHIPSRSPC